MNRNLHRYAVFTACCTFVLLVAGALVTSNEAGLSIPDWPLAYGSLAPPLFGGIFYEYGHRVVATFVGLLTIVLAIWLWRREPRRWVKKLGVLALGAVVAQGVLGGLTVLLLQPVAVSVAHASLAQIFFCTVVSLALFTSPWWQSDLPVHEDGVSAPVLRLGVWTVVATFLQIVLGAFFRHKGFGIVPHLIGAAVVAVLIFRVAGVLRRRFAQERALRGCARLLQMVIGVQLLLGAAAWWSRIYAAQFPQPVPLTVWLTVAHTVVGALTLAATLATALVSHRLIRPAATLEVASQELPAQ